jgi:hypothetical protein
MALRMRVISEHRLNMGDKSTFCLWSFWRKHWTLRGERLGVA